MIPTEQFKTVVEYTPLVSVDLIIKYKDKILLGKRVNKPAFGYYFTPGGILRKNESVKKAQKRIAKDELNLDIKSDPKFLGIFEHFYEDSIFNGISTHYLNLGFELEVDHPITDLPKEQHSRYRWLTIEDIFKSDEVHHYVKDYFKRGENR